MFIIHYVEMVADAVTVIIWWAHYMGWWHGSAKIKQEFTKTIEKLSRKEVIICLQLEKVQAFVNRLEWYSYD